MLCGTLPGEVRETPELGLKVPASGLYIKEEIDMTTNFLLTGFVKKNLQNAHTALLERLIVGVGIVESQAPQQQTAPSIVRSDTLDSYGATPSKTIASPMLARQSMRDVVEQRKNKLGSAHSPSASSISNTSPTSTYGSRETTDPTHPQYVAELPAQPEIAELDSTNDRHTYNQGYDQKPPVPSRNPGRNSGDRLSGERFDGRVQ